VTLPDRKIEGPVDLASGDGISIADLAHELGALAGRRGLIRLGAMPQRSGERPILIADTRRLRDEAEFRPAASCSVRLVPYGDWLRAAGFGRHQRQLSKSGYSGRETRHVAERGDRDLAESVWKTEVTCSASVAPALRSRL